MWFIWVLSWVTAILAFCFASLAVASGLYYLAELVEEFTTTAAKIIRYIILGVVCIYIGLLVFEDFPWTMIVCGITSQLAHLYVMRTFPYFVLASVPFISTLFFIGLNHYLAFSYFSSQLYPFSEVMSYFVICLWVVPFAFFVSLSANDLILPTQLEKRPLLGNENDVVSTYFSKQARKINLLGFFNSTRDMILPQRTKKSF